MSKKFLIVGDSSGIGLTLTNRFAAEGNKVFVLSRNLDQHQLSENIEHRTFDVLDEIHSFP